MRNKTLRQDKNIPPYPISSILWGFEELNWSGNILLFIAKRFFRLFCAVIHQTTTSLYKDRCALHSVKGTDIQTELSVVIHNVTTLGLMLETTTSHACFILFLSLLFFCFFKHFFSLHFKDRWNNLQRFFCFF